MQAALIVRYGRPSPGREQLAFGAFTEALAFFAAQATAGVCENPVVYMASSGGGMIVIGGERSRLLEMAIGEPFRRLFLKAGYAVPDLAHEIMLAGGDAVTEMTTWASVGSELGFI